MTMGPYILTSLHHDSHMGSRAPPGITAACPGGRQASAVVTRLLEDLASDGLWTVAQSLNT